MYLFLGRLIGILDVGIGRELSLERLKRRGQVGAPWKILKREKRRESRRERIHLKCPRSCLSSKADS